MYPYINIFGLHIPSYGLCVCLALFLCVALVFKRAYKSSIDFNDLIILTAISVGCGILGGNILYIFVTYDIETLYKKMLIGEFTFLKNSGLVFYGGIIGGILGAVISAKILKLKTEILERCIVPYIPLGHAVGRIGCLLAGCCYGFPYKGILAVSTPFDMGDITYFPIQGVEAILNLFVMGILLLYVKKERAKYSVMSLYLVMYSHIRFFLEFFRGDTIRGSFLFFSTSQWISLLIILFCFVLMLINKKHNTQDSI